MKINLISGPRNISTALMYAFAQRSDTQVLDEPFYGYYLATTGVEHPGREEVLENMLTSTSRILDEVIFAPQKTPVLFIKNMAHHLIQGDVDFLLQLINVFLIRDPKQLIASFAQVMPSPTMNDIGVKRQYELFHFLQSKTGQIPIVLNSSELLKNPRAVLLQLCQALHIPFEEQMLSWKAGPIKEDGIWAKYWYQNVHQSTGFELQSHGDRPLPDHCKTLYEEALPYYHELNQYTLKA